jgi:hypothetical protein
MHKKKRTSLNLIKLYHLLSITATDNFNKIDIILTQFSQIVNNLLKTAFKYRLAEQKDKMKQSSFPLKQLAAPGTK